MNFKLLETESTLNKNLTNYYVVTTGGENKETKKYYCDLIFGADAVEQYNKTNFKTKLISKEGFKEVQDKLSFALENIDKIKPLLRYTTFTSIYSDWHFGKSLDMIVKKYMPVDAELQPEEQPKPKKKKYDSQKRAEKNYKAKFKEFKLRLTPEQKETLRKKADKHNMTINSYLIWLMDNDVW